MDHTIIFPASPNWYCSRIVDSNSEGVVCFGAKNSLYLWDFSTPNVPKFIKHIIAHEERVVGVSLCKRQTHPSVDKHCVKCCSVGEDGVVKVWDLLHNAVLFQHSYHKSKLTTVHTSPLDADLVASGDDKGGVIVCNISSDDVWKWRPDPSHNHVFSLTFSPHCRTLLAVGFKTSAVIVLDISKKNQPVITRLRGHDDEIHSILWCPLFNHLEFYQQHEADTDVHMLASSSRDKTIRIWDVHRGECVSVLRLPQSSGYHRKERDDVGGKSRIWVALVWLTQFSNQLISSGLNGELIHWNIQDLSKPKWQIIGSGRGHNRIVFNIVETGPESSKALVSISMDRQIIKWELSSMSIKHIITSLGGYVHCISQSPLHPGKFAIGVGDNMIRVCGIDDACIANDVTTFWQGIRSKVTTISWHPVKENLLAYGTDDGRVGIYDVLTNKLPQISVTYHQKTVYVVVWAPVIIRAMSKTEDEMCLYSVGDGIILQHRPCALHQPALDISLAIREHNNITTKMPMRTEITWNADYKYVAIGNEDGSIDIFRHEAQLLLLCKLCVHKKIVNCIRWHPLYTVESTAISPCRYWLASGSNESVVHIFNLEQIVCIQTVNAKPLVITESYRRLEGHTNRITGLCWSVNKNGMLASASYDWTAQCDTHIFDGKEVLISIRSEVWDVLHDQSVANFRGHHGRILCVAWSLLDPDIVYTGADDYTLQAWKVSQQPHIRPPHVAEKKKASKVKKAEDVAVSRKSKQSSIIGSDAILENSLPGETETLQSTVDTAELLQLLEEKRLQITGEKTVENKLLSNETMDTNGYAVDSSEHESSSPIANEPSSTRSGNVTNKKDKLRKKRRPARSLFPKSSAADNRGKLPNQVDCIELAKLKQLDGGHILPESLQHLGCFVDRRNTLTLFQHEESYHLDHENIDQYTTLSMFKGGSTEALKNAAEKGKLTDYLMAIAPTVSMECWEELCDKYAKQLASDGQYHKASSYLLARNNVYGAIKLLADNKLYKDAVCLARVRLPSSDATLRELYVDWGQQLIREGNFELAAKCYLAVEDILEAARLLTSRADLTALKAAALVTLSGNEIEASLIYAYKYVQESLMSSDWTGATNLISSSKEYDVLALMASVYESLIHEISDLEVIQSFMDSEAQNRAMGKDLLNELQFETTSCKLCDSAVDTRTTLENPWLPPLVEFERLLEFLLLRMKQKWNIVVDSQNVDELYVKLLKLKQAKQGQSNTKHVLLEMSLNIALGALKLYVKENELAAAWFVVATVQCLTLDDRLLQHSHLLLPRDLSVVKDHIISWCPISCSHLDDRTDYGLSSVAIKAARSNHCHSLRALYALNIIRFLLGHKSVLSASVSDQNKTSGKLSIHSQPEQRKEDCFRVSSSCQISCPVLRCLSQTMLCDVQVKRCELRESIGYIEKAIADLISMNLAAQENDIVPQDDTQSDGIQSLSNNNSAGDDGQKQTVTALHQGDITHNNNASTCRATATIISKYLSSEALCSIPETKALMLVNLSKYLSLITYSTTSDCITQAKTFWSAVDSLGSSTELQLSRGNHGQEIRSSSDHEQCDNHDLGSASVNSSIPEVCQNLLVDEKYSRSYVTIPVLIDELKRLQSELRGIDTITMFPHPLECAVMLFQLASQLASSVKDRLSDVSDLQPSTDIVLDSTNEQSHTVPNILSQCGNLNTDKLGQDGYTAASECSSSSYKQFAESVRRWGLIHSYSTAWKKCFES